MDTPGILFIARAFPPVIGGIEKQNYEICKALGNRASVIALVNTRGKLFLPLFLLRCFWNVVRLRKNYDVILLGDGVLAVVAFAIKLFSKVPVCCIVHGLDLTYSGLIYRLLWRRLFFHSIDHFIAVSNETIRQGLVHGLDRTRFTFIPNGVDTANLPQPYSRTDLAKVLGYQPNGPVILTLGRLVKRKGVAWFVTNVMPKLPVEFTYVIAGDGKESKEITRSIKAMGMEQRVRFLGGVSAETKAVLLSASDLFVQPNIPVANDMEGFGLVVLEAALAGTLVVASRLEGLKDAIVEGRNGVLVEPLDADKYKSVICELLAAPEELARLAAAARDFVTSTYSWSAVVERYLEVIRKL